MEEKKYETNGALSWSELMTSDLQGAKEFYSKLFNWRFEKYSGEADMEYYSIYTQNGEEPFAGIYDKKEAVGDVSNIPSFWGNYITVLDIDDSISKVQNLGGNVIVPKTSIPKVGDFAVIQDPQGAVISIMQYSLEECPS